MATYIVAEFEQADGKFVTVTKDTINGVYAVLVNYQVVQPNHDAEGIIRYLSNLAHNYEHRIAKLEKEAK